jgi:hypothetical protein
MAVEYQQKYWSDSSMSQSKSHKTRGGKALACYWRKRLCKRTEEKYALQKQGQQEQQ